MKIPGGYIIKARCIERSKISIAPPCTRETWNWLLLNANFAESKYKGFTVNRGQIFCRYSDIINGLSWYQGYKKCTYTQDQMKTTMRHLRQALMVTTSKHRQGVLITICNYDKYQDFKNYESTNEGTTRTPTRTPNTPDIAEGSKKNKEILLESEFDRFWELFQKKEDRKKCFVKWKNLKIKDKELIFKTISAYVQSTPDKQYRKNPLTWLNGECWNNDYSVEKKQKMPRF